MRKILPVFLTLVCFTAFSQKTPTELAQPIVDEGKSLYKSEMASWYGTDLFVEKFQDQSKIGGYFSYIDNGIAKCVFIKKDAEAKVIGTISFDSTYNTATAKVDLTERNLTPTENNYYVIRQLALAEIKTDTLFKTYNNTSLNLIPLITNNEKKVYVLTGPSQNGVVIFGNDYLLTFDKDNKLLAKKQLHKNIIPINYGGKEEQNMKEIEGTIHSHLPETGDFITATDICTLMLYEKFTKWKQHNVVSKNYLNIWDCQTDHLVVVPMGVVDKINKKKD